jgi:hypothetical protein
MKSFITSTLLILQIFTLSQLAAGQNGGREDFSDSAV